MPLYAYRCNNCGHEFEVRQRFSDGPLSDCPQCDGTVRRIISQVGVVFKGSGFYVTDNRNGKANSYLNSGKGDGKSDGATSDGATSDGTKAESKADSGSAPPKDTGNSQKPAASAS
jgi:putative FmdB family regulatory protein